MVLDASIDTVGNTQFWFSVYKLHIPIMCKIRAVIARVSVKFLGFLIVISLAKIQTTRNNIENSEGVNIDFFLFIFFSQKHELKYFRIQWYC